MSGSRVYPPFRDPRGSWVYAPFRWGARVAVRELYDLQEQAEGAWRHLRRALALVLPALLLLLASLVSSFDRRTVPLPPTEPPVPRPTPVRVERGPGLGPFIGNVYQAVDIDLEALGEVLHLTRDEVEAIRAEIQDPERAGREVDLTAADLDVHLTEADIARIERAVRVVIGDVLLTRQQLVDLVLELMPEPPDPVTRASTGPALQFGPLAGVLRGFLYDLEVDRQPPLPIREIGLTLQLRSGQGCAEGELQLTVRRFPGGEVVDDGCRAVRSGRRRNDPWTDCASMPTPATATRASDCDRTAAAHFQLRRPPGPGFWYAIVVASDGAGHYVIVRRCATRCWEGPSDETSEVGG